MLTSWHSNLRMQRRDIGEAQHQCWKKFLIWSCPLLCSDCGICFNLASLGLYRTTVFLHCCNLAAWHCTVADAFSLRHKINVPVWSNSEIMRNRRKANTTNANLLLFLLKQHFMGENVMKWESPFHSMCMFISVVDRKVESQLWHLTMPPLQWVEKAIIILKYWLNSKLVFFNHIRINSSTQKC